jgi:hypothetical protein
MKLKFTRLLSAAIVVLLGVNVGTPVLASSINTSMLTCQPLQPGQADLRHTEAGTSTDGVFPTSRYVTCSVRRSPNLGTTGGLFYVTGDNRDGMSTTTCTLFSYDYTGAFLGSASFTRSAPHYTQILVIPAAQLGYWAYTSLTCLLPENNRATIESAIAVQS